MKNNKGQTFAEFALGVGLIAVIALVVMFGLGISWNHIVAGITMDAPQVKVFDQTHALARHGVEAALVPLQCQDEKNPRVELYNPSLNKWLYVCFLEDGSKLALWVLCKQIGLCEANDEITAIPASDISKPVNYVSSVIRRGYELVSVRGNVPGWIIEALARGVVFK
jgi:hypothetical protein